MSLIDDTKDILAELIAFPTVSTDSNLHMIQWLAQRLGDLGAQVEIWYDGSGNKANLFATLGPMRDGGIVLSGHSDVVPVADQDWTTDPFEMIEKNGKLYGRGACDMKGFIAAVMAMAPRYAALDLQRPLHFAFTYDEETGCLGAQALAEQLVEQGIRPTVAIIGEPTMMKIIEGHKGCCEYSTHFTGLEGHGSSPDLGVNAVEYAVRFVGRLMELKDELKPRAPASSRFDPPWTTINTGALIGGVAHNVIPGKARVDWEMRPVQKSDMTFVKDAVHDYVTRVLEPAMQEVCPDAGIETEVIGEVGGLEPMEPCEARELVSALTGGNDVGVVPFGTEAGIFQDIGMSVVVCGPGSIAQAHKPDEFVAVEQMEQCLDMLERLCAKLV